MNGHMHISYAHPVRGIFPDEMASPLNHVFNLQAAMTEEEEYHASLLGIVELLKSGTVCFVDPGSTKFPDACLQAYEDSGIRVIMGECVTDIQAPWNLPKHATGEAVRRTAAFIDKWNGRLDGRLTAWAMPFSPETCTAELLSELKKVVDERRTMLTLHHNSGAQQRKDYQARHGRRPTEYLESLGVVGPNVLLAHVLGIDDAEIDCIARTRTAVAMCPITAAKGGRGVPEHGRMPELLAKGVKIALGADSPNNCNHLDMVRVMNMAAIQYKDARQDTRQIPAEAALEMATLSGRRGARPGRSARLHRGREEGRLRALRHGAAGVAGDVEPGEQPGLQRRRQERAHGDRGRPRRGRRVPPIVRGRAEALRQGAGDRRAASGEDRHHLPALPLADRLTGVIRREAPRPSCSTGRAH